MSDRRLIVFTGTADFNVIIGDIGNYEPTVRDAFINAGWDIVTVRMNKAVLFTTGVNITIEANVVNYISAEDARVVATDVLNSIQIGYLYQGPLFTDVALRVLSEGPLSNAPGDTTLNTTLSKITSTASQLATDAIKEGAKGLGGNIGIPLAIGAVILGILVLYKPSVGRFNYR